MERSRFRSQPAQFLLRSRLADTDPTLVHLRCEEIGRAATELGWGYGPLTFVSLLLLGGLLAADAALSLRATTALAGLIGLFHGYLNAVGMGRPADGALALLGLVVAVRSTSFSFLTSEFEP